MMNDRPKSTTRPIETPKLSDGTAALGEGTTAAPTRSVPSVANLLISHVLRDGEVILLILKPSRWYVVLNSLLFAAGVAWFSWRNGARQVLLATAAWELIEPATPEQKRLVNVVEEMAIASGLPRPRIWVESCRVPRARCCRPFCPGPERSWAAGLLLLLATVWFTAGCTTPGRPASRPNCCRSWRLWCRLRHSTSRIISRRSRWR